MKKRTKELVGLALIAVFVICLVTTGTFIYVNQPDLILTGSLYFNDSGEHHGGFEMAMQWNITLFLRESSGHLLVTPEPGYSCNDVLLKFSYTIGAFKFSEQNISLSIDGHPVLLEFVVNDTIWNRYHNQYISSTPDFSPTIFPGFLSHFYVELRLARPPVA